MPGAQREQSADFLDAAFDRVALIEDALGELTRGVQEELVAGAPVPNGNRIKLEVLAEALGGISAASLGLVANITTTTGISPQPEQAEASVGMESQPAIAEQEASKDKKPDLYARILEPAQLPQRPPVDEAEAVKIEIIGDKKIQIDGQRIRVVKRELFIFNALFSLGEGPHSSAEFRGLGFFPEATELTKEQDAFTYAMKSLRNKLDAAATEKVIIKTGAGGGTRYELNPSAVLMDKRVQASGGDVAVGVKKK